MLFSLFDASRPLCLLVQRVKVCYNVSDHGLFSALAGGGFEFFWFFSWEKERERDRETEKVSKKEQQVGFAWLRLFAPCDKHYIL